MTKSRGTYVPQLDALRGIAVAAVAYSHWIAPQYQFGVRWGTVGVTLCYEPGEGAGPQPASDYSLVASNHEHEGGIFRVDLRNGNMSVCYLLKDKVVCTPPAK